MFWYRDIRGVQDGQVTGGCGRQEVEVEEEVKDTLFLLHDPNYLQVFKNGLLFLLISHRWINEERNEQLAHLSVEDDDDDDDED